LNRLLGADYLTIPAPESRGNPVPEWGIMMERGWMLFFGLATRLFFGYYL
jgi:hypothetical protein